MDGPEINRRPARPAKKHVSRACMGLECIMPQEIDGRKVPTKERYAVMERYAQTLESFILSKGMELPPNNDTVEAQPSALALAHNNPATSIGEEEEEEEEHIRISFPAQKPARRPEITDPTARRYSEDISGAVDLLSERLGSLQVAEDGQLRFFGPTSNLHITHVGPYPLIETVTQSIHGREHEILHHAAVDNFVDVDLEEHLLRLYFCWENPNIPVVDERTYYFERSNYRKTGRPCHRYSEVLTNAMCAVGAALTSRACPELPENLVNLFASRAKVLLDIEMDSPTLCTVQSLVILSGVEALLTRDARGWLYSGMAMRLSTDLGLHLSPKFVTDGGVQDPEEIRLRKLVFWGAFIHDRMWSFYVGRPESLDQQHISIGKPGTSDLTCGDHPNWRLYIDNGQPSVHKELPAVYGEIAKETVNLCLKMAAIRKVLYQSCQESDSNMSQLHEWSRRLRADVLAWSSQLPPFLSFNPDNPPASFVPHLAQLHMQYHAILVIIDRPFAFSPSQPSGLTEKEIETSRRSCTQSAAAIAKLIRALRRQYSLRRMNIHTVHLIFTAALVHVHNAYISPESSICATARQDLQTSCEALSEVGRSYKNALRALEVITCIKSDLLKRRQSRLKRGSVNAESPHTAQSVGKRARVDTQLLLQREALNECFPLSPSYGDCDPDGFDLLDLGLEDTGPATLGGQHLMGEAWSWTPSTDCTHYAF
ncbi:hypothetical protein FE257_011986 [Aspergillus nanangensis]|uniref:Xylanolytic transcriptional activator regulatory domain-containing protein n=1 Tax=Aspergillus nanangensis TaxID=2582783 RepID=A0AAD4CGN1_ASPNN|nr:hypothetical protein FE257_011986 [Aspergillus nanangensis]